jgi:hypothetical protein
MGWTRASGPECRALILLAGGDVLEGAPAAGEQGEPAFAQAAQRAEHGVAGAGIDAGVPPASGLPDRDVHADASSFAAGIARVSSPAAAAGYSAGGGDVVHRARLHLRDTS